MHHFQFMVSLVFYILIIAVPGQAKMTIAYISDSPSSSVPQWIAKETGIFKKYGLDIDLVFIDGSTRGIQALLGRRSRLHPKRWVPRRSTARVAGGNIAIINGIVNTLPYYIVGNPAIKSRGRYQGAHRGRAYTRHGGRLCLAPCALKEHQLAVQSDQSDHRRRRAGAASAP